jgi:hypothetical protein
MAHSRLLRPYCRVRGQDLTRNMDLFAIFYAPYHLRKFRLRISKTDFHLCIVAKYSQNFWSSNDMANRGVWLRIRRGRGVERNRDRLRENRDR